jgi:hypothetical protein
MAAPLLTHLTLTHIYRAARESVPGNVGSRKQSNFESSLNRYDNKCPLSGVKRTYRMHCTCLLLTQTGHVSRTRFCTFVVSSGGMPPECLARILMRELHYEHGPDVA